MPLQWGAVGAASAAKAQSASTSILSRRGCHGALQSVVDTGGKRAVAAVPSQWAGVCVGEDDTGVLMQGSRPEGRRG